MERLILKLIQLSLIVIIIITTKSCCQPPLFNCGPIIKPLSIIPSDTTFIFNEKNINFKFEAWEYRDRKSKEVEFKKIDMDIYSTKYYYNNGSIYFYSNNDNKIIIDGNDFFIRDNNIFIQIREDYDNIKENRIYFEDVKLVSAENDTIIFSFHLKIE